MKRLALFLLATFGAFQLFAQSDVADTAEGIAAFGTNTPAGGGGGGAITRKQFKHAYTINGQTTSATFDSATTAGSAIIAVTSGFTTDDSGVVTDLQGNTYTLLQQILGSGGTRMSVYAAFGIVGGADTVTVATSGESDSSISIFEYSGVTAVDTSGVDTSGASVSVTTTHTAIFFGAWASESFDTYTTPVLTPGTISATTIHHDTGHYDAQFEILNSGAGFAAGSYTVAISGSSGAFVLLALKP